MVHIYVIFIGILLSYIAIICTRKIAIRCGLSDKPGGRKKHAGEIPLIGGISIFTALIFTTLLGIGSHHKLSLITSWAGIVFLIGIVDDFKPLSWKLRLLAQTITILGIIFTTGISIKTLGVFPLIGELHLGSFNVPFTIFAVVGMTNAFNLIDGIDGLCGVVAIITLFALLLLGFHGDQSYMLFTVNFILAVTVYLSFNLQKKSKHKIFLGDSGSCTIGFIISWLLIDFSSNDLTSSEPSLALWLVAVPIIDTFNSMYQRAIKRQHIFLADQNHLHHQLSKSGLSDHSVLTFMIIISMIGVSIGILVRAAETFISASLFVCFAISLVLIIKNIVPQLIKNGRLLR